MSAVAETPMAKKQSPKSRPSGWGESKPIVAQLRGTDDFKAWITAYAKFRRMSISQLIEQELVEGAKTRGFTEPPPER